MSVSTATSIKVELPSPAQLRRFDAAGPRYTSYPTADRFVEAYDARAHASALSRRDAASGSLSIYVHLPFCDTICYYCGCNKVVTRDHSRAARYLQALQREADLVVECLSGPRSVEQLHLGGGTPTFLSIEELVWRRFLEVHTGMLGLLIVVLVMFLPRGILSLKLPAKA